MYRYRCDQCATTSLPVRTRAEAVAARDKHRRLMHGGHVPDGEHLLRRRRTGPRPQDIRPLVWIGVAIGVLLLAWITR